ncbi:uncharacterized protein isoform X2 [Choristoneura fumiferana]|uniref:uncharacterized protein isoform X2 n=1 Tax=Choristoneura fumiferana TaxID=7141 RepID=UPI003D15C44F
MGGCRCTYRNCTVRSDGKTHFFHYPVFDKVRCHQWLTNAGRYEFLNLKKDKLKLQAVPTEDGPFCDSSKFNDSGMPKETQGVYPLVYEDIENDEYIPDRKANYNIKYAHFLTNSEETSLLNDVCKMEVEDKKKLTEIKIATEPITITSNSKQVLQKLRINSNNIIEPNKATENGMFTHEIIVEPCPPAQTIANEIATVKPIPQPVQRRNNKIKIISEKKITEPEKQIPVPLSNASFEIVSPSMVLNVNKLKPKNQSNIVPLQCNTENETNLPEIISNMDPRKFEMKVDLEEVEPPSLLKVPVENNINKPISEPVQPVVTQKKLSAERLAAINAKRKFNMKLKDIIEAGLNQLDIEDSSKKKTRSISRKKQPENETVASSLSKDLSLPNNCDYIISYLESRMNRMENLLMSKIDQNTQKIMALKRTFEPQTEDPPTSSFSIKRTKLQHEAHKRHLYKEIKKYLTPDTNSIVYEELFINKFKPNANPEPDSLKRRRRR